MAFYLPLPTAAVVALTISAFCYLCYRAALPRPLPGIPYNKKSAKRFLGDAPDLFKHVAEHGDAFSYVAKMAIEMNEPIFQVFMQPLGRPWVVIMDSRETNDILTRRMKDFDRSSFFGQIFSSMLPNAHVHMPTSDEWHTHRRLISDTMSPAFLNQVAGPQMWDCMQKLVVMWKEKARLAEGRPFSAYDDIHNTTLDIIWAATFGGSMGPNTARTDQLAGMDRLDSSPNLDEPVVFPELEDPPEFKSIITLVESMTIPVNSKMPKLAHWFALQTRRSLIDARRKKDELIRDKLKEALTRLANTVDDLESTAGLKSALDLVLSKELKMARKEGRRANFDSPAIKDELFLFLIAGEDTTSTALCWIVKLSTAHRKVQSTLRSILGDSFKRACVANETPSAEEITSTSVPYVEAVIEEGLRIGGTIPSLVRKALRDTEVLGHHIPAGTDVFMVSVKNNELVAETRMSRG